MNRFVAAALVVLVGVMTAACRPPARKIIRSVPDPTGRWVAVVDEVEYSNGLLTSVADRVLLAQSGSMSGAGTIVLSKDADRSKPIVEWSADHLVITVDTAALLLHEQPSAHGITIEIRRR